MRARRSSIVEGFGGEVFHAFAGLRGLLRKSDSARGCGGGSGGGGEHAAVLDGRRVQLI